MINVTITPNEGMIVVEPSGPLEQADFEKLTKEIDAYPGGRSHLIGLIIHAKSFPGWDDYSAFLQHMRFVKAHHKTIQRVAIVTDSKIGTIAPAIANPFVSAQLKHFEYDDIDEAKQWIRKAV